MPDQPRAAQPRRPHHAPYAARNARSRGRFRREPFARIVGPRTGAGAGMPARMLRRNGAAGLIVAAAFALVTACSAAPPATGPVPNPITTSPTVAPNPPVVTIDAGVVRGSNTDRVDDSFLGIPYAAPPVGDLRWAAPQPPARRGPGCARRPRSATRARRWPAPTARGRRPRTACSSTCGGRPGAAPGDRLPVYVFIHGGGLVNGSSNQDGRGEDRRARPASSASRSTTGSGVFGFLGAPGPHRGAAASPATTASLDQQAALRWVQRNIAAFGGDPAPGDHRRRVGRRLVGVRPSGGARLARAVRAGHDPERLLPEPDRRPRPRRPGPAFAAAAGCTDPATAVACLRAAPVGRAARRRPQPPARLVRGTPVLPATRPRRSRSGQFARVPVRDRRQPRRGPHVRRGLHRLDRGPVRRLGAGGRSAANADAVLARYPWPATADQFTAAVPASARS